MDIGSELRSARMRKTLTIEQLADLTKIRLPLLQAIERNDFDQLPGAIYARAFLKAYAREVGLDPDDIVARYMALQPPADVQTVPSTPSVPWRALLTGWRLIAGALVLVWLSVSYLAFHRTNVTQPAHAGEVTTAVSGSAATAPRVAGTSGSTERSASPLNEAVRAINLQLQITGPCWVAADADGNRVVNRLMNAGERESIDARDAITLRVGDPAALKFSINGVPGRSLGEPGQAVTVRITPQNYSSFVKAAEER